MNMCLSLLEKNLLYYLIVWHCLEIRHCCVNTKLPYQLNNEHKFSRIKMPENAQCSYETTAQKI